MRMLCSVILTSVTVVVNLPTEMESGTFPMELKLVFREFLKMNFTGIEAHKLYASIINKAYLRQKEDFSDVKCQILRMSRRLSM